MLLAMSSFIISFGVCSIGKWQMAFAQMANGKWQMANGKWQMANDVHGSWFIKIWKYT